MILLSSPEPEFISGGNNLALTGAAGYEDHLLSSHWLAARLAASHWLCEAALTLRRFSAVFTRAQSFLGKSVGVRPTINYSYLQSFLEMNKQILHIRYQMCINIKLQVK